MNGQLSDVVLEICEDEFAEYSTLPQHKFSLRFRRKMDKLIQNQYVPEPSVQTTTLRCMKFAIIALVTAVVLLTGFIVTDTVFTKESETLFGFESFAVKYSGTAPKTIENYYEPIVPDGFVKNEKASYSTDKFHTSAYYNGECGYVFSQSVISEFYLGVERDKTITEYSYNENKITIRYEEGNLVDIVWCDGVYVYHLGTVNAVKDIFDLEKLVEVFPKEIKTAEEIYSEIM